MVDLTNVLSVTRHLLSNQACKNMEESMIRRSLISASRKDAVKHFLRSLISLDTIEFIWEINLSSVTIVQRSLHLVLT